MAERTARRRRSTPRLGVRIAAWIIAGVLVLTLVARLLRAQAWAFDMVGMFAAQEVALALLLGIAAIALRARGAGVVLLGVAITHWAWLGFAPRAPRDRSAPASRTVSVLTFNAFAENRDRQLVIDTILESGADVAFLLEVFHDFADEMRASPELTARYPYHSLPEGGKLWGFAVFSRWPLHELDMRFEHHERWVQVRGNYSFVRSAIVERPEGRFLISAMLPDSPRTPARWAGGNAELRETAAIMRDYLIPMGYPMVVGVDMNATPSGYRTGMMKRLSGLRRAKPWLVPRGTWPSSIPAILRVAIDDVLVSNSIHVTSWTTIERRTGSDHVPVLVRLVLPAKGPAEGVDRR